MRGREPIGEIEDHAGEEARFDKSEQKTQDEKADRPANEGKRARNQAPGHHYAGNPAPGADPIEDQIARHLQDEIALEERPAPSPKIEALSPRSLFIVRAANPMFTRSR